MHLIRVPPRCLPLELLIQTHHTGRRAEPEHAGGTLYLETAWDPLKEELEHMAEKKDISVALLRLLPPQPPGL